MTGRAACDLLCTSQYQCAIGIFTVGNVLEKKILRQYYYLANNNFYQ